MLGKLVPCGGGAPLPLLKTTLILGRKPECDITVPCPSVSGRHCILQLEQGSWWVRDLDSKNGTSVNAQRCEKQRIAPNDILTVGRQRLVLDYKRVQNPPAPTTAHDREEDLAFEFLTGGTEESPTVSTVSQGPSSVPLLKPTPPPPPSPRPAAADLGRLVPCGGGAPIPLRLPELILGRNPDCNVCFRFASVSSRHCKLTFDEGYWVVEDLNSTNGTWVDGTRCLMQCLMPESVLALDKHRFTIHYVLSGQGSPPVITRLFTQSLLEKAGLAKEFADDRLPKENDSDRPKRYNLLDPDDR